MYNKLIQVNVRNMQILSFYAITLYNFDYYKNKGKLNKKTVSDNKKKWSNVIE
jgi:hypothetical protein